MVTTVLLLSLLHANPTRAHDPPARHLRLLDSSSPWVAQSTSGSRAGELETRIDALNSQLRSLNTNWPIGSVVAAYFGYGLAPLVLPGGGLLAVAGIIGTRIAPGLLIAGLAVTGVGIL